MSLQNNSQADAYYHEGLAFAQQAEWGRAASCFRKALSIDPNSPARENLEMLDEIFSFYHKDNFNP